MNPGSTYLLETLKSFKGMKSNTEKALAQLSDAQLHYAPNQESNSAVILMQHLAGNMLSRFTDFLTTDGEKPNRNRDAEFIDHFTNREALFNYWEKGWSCLISVIESLQEEVLLKTVFIRNEPHSVLRALNRQLIHYAYHCGQIVYVCKLVKGIEFENLSIPRGKSGDVLSVPPGESSPTSNR